MFIKKFEAPSLEQALAQIKHELGPNALVLSTQHRKGKWFGKHMVEVTAAIEKRAKESLEENTFDEAELAQVFPHRKPAPRTYETVAPAPAKPKPADIPGRRIAGSAKVTAPAGEHREEIAQARASRTANDPERFQPGFLQRGFSPEMARELSRRMVFDFPAKDLATAAFVEKTRAKLVAAPLRTLSSEIFQEKTSWTAIGLPGSGKTTLLVKLGLYLKAKGTQVQLVGADKRKVSARAELSAYARILQVPFHGENALDKDFLELQLVDSPSFLPGDEEGAKRLEAIVSHRRCFLVLDAGQRLSEMQRIVDKAERFQPVGVAFTRLDAVAGTGVIHDLLKTTKLPLVGASISGSFTTPFRFFEPTELAHFILNQAGGPA